MKMVIAHEVGHALGLPHNMSASKAYDVESYRDGTFTQEFGIAATIMDYARYNYIAQPGDENIRFIRQIGPYDHYAINWGYRQIPDAYSAEAERPLLDAWIMEKAGDPKYIFGKQSSRFDPTSQTEDIGNDAIKASNYALKNLKYVAQNLPEWTSGQTNDYEDLEELYGELLSCYNRYVGHVISNIGGVEEHLITPEQSGIAYVAVPKDKQQESMQWAHENAFETPNWLVNKSLLQNIDYAGYTERVRRLQSRYINSLLNFETLGRLIDHHTINPNNYSALGMLEDLRKGVWSEVNSTKNVEVYRRNLQRAYVERMAYLMTEDLNPDRTSQYFNVNQSDIRALVRGELSVLKKQVSAAANRNVDTETKYHYQDIAERIETIFEPGE